MGNMDLGLKGQVALVTAGGRGLGLAIAEELAQEGARIVLSARNAENLVRVTSSIADKTGAEIIGIAADGTRTEDVDRLVQQTEDRLGPIEILVNNSAGPAAADFMTLSDDDWRAAIDVKLMAQIRCARAVFPRMVKRGRGRIVNFAGTHGLLAHSYAITAGVVNAALLNLTKALAEQGASNNVLVNAINPGPILTERMNYLTEIKAKELGVTYEDARAYLVSETLLKRFGTPQEIAATVVFLVSRRAGYITGTYINVDGGQVRSL
jgi:3-oxoacyl-[acyl-carrier protein] reductase